MFDTPDPIILKALKYLYLNHGHSCHKIIYKNTHLAGWHFRHHGWSRSRYGSGSAITGHACPNAVKTNPKSLISIFLALKMKAVYTDRCVRLSGHLLRGRWLYTHVIYEGSSIIIRSWLYFTVYSCLSSLARLRINIIRGWDCRTRRRSHANNTRG